MSRKKPPARTARAKTRRFRFLPTTFIRRIVLSLAGALLLAALGVTVFVGVRCYGSVETMRSRVPPDVPSTVRDYARPEAFTYLTLPEWFIVYSADEYAQVVATRPPSAFPYLTSAVHYWGYYDAACQATRSSHPFEAGYHVMLGVIGVSFTAESLAKSLYENSLGRVTAWLSTTDTPEDRFAAQVARDYGRFMHTTPWYEFPFGSRLRQLWTAVPMSGAHPVRKWERRLVLSAEYAGKAVYGWLIGLASRGAYSAEATTIQARIIADGETPLNVSSVQTVMRTPRGAWVVRLPRYEAFTPAALTTLEHGAQFVDIAGNNHILLTAIAPMGIRTEALRSSRVLVTRPLLATAGRTRLAARVAVPELRRAVVELRAAGATIEHLYDY